MKKTIVILLLLVCEMLGTQLQAEIIPFENLSARNLRNVLSEKYGTKVDKDGDLVISTNNGRIFLSVISSEDEKLLRLSVPYSKYDKLTTQELINLANKWNDSKRILRVSVDPKDGSSTCNYYLILAKGIDSENLLATIDWFIYLQNRWNKFVIDNGKTTDE